MFDSGKCPACNSQFDIQQAFVSKTVAVCCSNCYQLLAVQSDTVNPSKSLQDYVDVHGVVSYQSVVKCCADVCKTLRRYHQLRRVHGDVRPANILVLEGGDVFVLAQVPAMLENDMPWKHSANVSSEREVRYLADRAYFMPPEIVMPGRVFDRRSDIYSLGCMAYRLLSGEFPVQASGTVSQLYAHIVEESKPLRDLWAEVPTQFAKICERMLAKEPKDRFQSVDEIEIELDNL